MTLNFTFKQDTSQPDRLQWENLRPVLYQSICAIGRLLKGGVCTIVLLGGCFFLSAIPAFAQSNTINYTSTDLTGRSFVGEDLNGAVFVSAEMRDVNLKGANLQGSMFTKANLYGADLSDTDLTNALVDRVTLYKANLRNSVLTGATLTNTLFEQTDITNADFTDALVDRYTVSLLCKTAQGVNPVTGIETRESLGCR